MSAAGAVIMSIFGAIWWVVGARATGRTSTTFYAIPAVITLALLAAAFRTRAIDDPADAAGESRRGRLVAIWSAIEGALILIAVNVLNNIGKSEYVSTAIAAIVGLHFVPLARSLPARRYYATAALFVAISIASFWVEEPSQRLWLVSAASACLLWLTSATVV